MMTSVVLYEFYLLKVSYALTLITRRESSKSINLFFLKFRRQNIRLKIFRMNRILISVFNWKKNKILCMLRHLNNLYFET
jgi:hypothetical protein